MKRAPFYDKAVAMPFTRAAATEDLMAKHLHDEASDVVADHGEVQVSGPDGVAVSLTPDAAEETGSRLIEAANEARLQARSLQAAPSENSQ